MIKASELNWDKAYFINCYPFHFLEALEDFYNLEPNGFVVIRDNDSLPMDSEIKKVLQEIGQNIEDYNIQGSVAAPVYEQQGSFKALSNNWKPTEIEKKLYIFLLNETVIATLKTEIGGLRDVNGNINFHVEWLSYCKNGKTLIDVVHAYNGATEQLHLSHKLSSHRIQVFCKKYGLKVES